MKCFNKGNHPNDKLAKELFQELVPLQGECTDTTAENIRAINRVGHDYWCNGMGNLVDGEYIFNLWEKAKYFATNNARSLIEEEAIKYVDHHIVNFRELHEEFLEHAYEDCDCEEFEEYGECCCNGFEPPASLEDLIDAKQFELSLNIIQDIIVVAVANKLKGVNASLCKQNLNEYKKKYMVKEESVKEESKTLTGLKVELLGSNGNAFSILAKVTKALRKNGYEDLIEKYTEEAQSGDYDHLLTTTIKYVEVC